MQPYRSSRLDNIYNSYMERNILERILEGTEEPTNIPFALLENITGHFSEEQEIGQDEFATFYKGILLNENVAVKRIMNSHSIKDKLFYREVNILLDVRHENVVQFLGYCANTETRAMKIDGSRERIHAEIRERLLCFEYLSNGNLQNYMTDEFRGLEWNTRYRIIQGICSGLYYLHKQKEIFHMDLTPSSILLDNRLEPKIAGFGLSRLNEQSQTMSRNRFLSIGYCAPEYIRSGTMSFKSDMYSLGVIIIELVTGHKGIPNKNSVLRRWRHRWRKSGKVTPLGYQEVTKCIEIGLLCQDIDPCKRPFIWDVVRAINEMEATNGQISTIDEQISPYSEDDMLGIEPLQLYFPFELKKPISNTLELTNETCAYIVFNIQSTTPLQYFMEPTKGIVPPRSKCSVKITLQPQEKVPEPMTQAYAFILQSTKVKDGLAADDITADMFKEEAGNMIDEVDLDVVFYAAQLESELPDVHELEVSFPFEPDNKIPIMLNEEARTMIVNLDVVLDTTQLQNDLLDDHKLELRFPLQPINLVPIVFKLEYLKAITCDFAAKSELGRGGYGVVYKGVFPSGEFIAVKKLFEIHLVKDETFQNEVSLLAGIEHRNVVQFVGYCAESSWELMPQPTGKPIWAEMPKRFICFEYACNGSLDKYISDESTGLEWNMRYEIIKGICNGLHFLHEKHHIVHLDLKPENVLMDAAMMPKITDFGISRIFGNQETRIITVNPVGSRGYMAPEYTMQGLITTKADIFSLGVIIIQILTGHKDYPLSSTYFEPSNANDCPQSADTSFQQFSEKVVGRWRNNFPSMVNYKLMGKYTQQVKECIVMALKCVHPDKEKRPTAKDIIQRLTAADQEGSSPTPLLESSTGHQNYQEATKTSSEAIPVTDKTT